jgi:hypothetical protein
MTTASTPHSDPLRAVRDAVRDSIRTSGRPRCHDVETCLDVSSRHVGVALWAAGLERVWRRNEAAGEPPLLGLDHALLVTATPTLLFGSAVTALDQCVASAAFWEAATPGKGFKDKRDKWYSTGDLLKGAKREATPFPAPPWFDSWFDALVAHGAWDLTKPYRNRQLHQIQSRSVAMHVPTVTVTASVGGSRREPRPTPPPASSVEQFGPTITPGGRDVQQHYDEVSAFVLAQWTAFWQHF